jgi:hypothetical protein
MLVFYGVTKEFDGDRTNGLTTTFGAVGGIFIKHFCQWLSAIGAPAGPLLPAESCIIRKLGRDMGEAVEFVSPYVHLML